MKGCDILSDMKKNAFTLIEMLVVLAIITIILGVGIPFFRGGSQRMRLKSALRGSIALFNYARMEAISRRKWVKVELGPSSCLICSVRDGEGNWSPMDKSYCLPRGLSANWQGASEVVFFPSGEARSMACLAIKNDIGRSKKVCVSELSGKVFIE